LEDVANMKSVTNLISYLNENSWIFIPPIAILINFLKLKTELIFLIFSPNSISNSKKIKWQKLFIFLYTVAPYFYLNFWSFGNYLFDPINVRSDLEFKIKF
jgi:hypothetical protein